MNVEIWSDVVCPWCYIGKRRFEEALSQFTHRDQVTVIWRSYQLDPGAPKTSEETVNEVLAKKYHVSKQQAQQMNDRVSTLAAEVGLDYHLENALQCNTFDAHRLIHLAAKHEVQDAMKERLLKAYFTDGEAVGDNETLIRLAGEVGLDTDEARAVLASDTYADEVKADIRRARVLGVQGVPFFVIDEKYGISGAQPTELFSEALEQVWAEAHPLIKVGGTQQDGSICDDESCAL